MLLCVHRHDMKSQKYIALLLCVHRPSGGLISSDIWCRDRYVVAFFEKNGQQKNNINFELRAQHTDMKVTLCFDVF